MVACIQFSQLCIANAVPESLINSCNKQCADVPVVTSQIKLYILDSRNNSQPDFDGYI